MYLNSSMPSRSVASYGPDSRTSISLAAKSSGVNTSGGTSTSTPVSDMTSARMTLTLASGWTASDTVTVAVLPPSSWNGSAGATTCTRSASPPFVKVYVSLCAKLKPVAPEAVNDSSISWLSGIPSPTASYLSSSTCGTMLSNVNEVPLS